MGDWVRIEKYKHVFQKGYTARFTNEIFRVAEVHTERSPVTYRIRDENGELIRGWFYGNDLCRVLLEPQKDEKLNDIERVLKKKKRKGVDYLFVKWKGFASKHNSWIPASSLTWKNI